MSRPLAPPQDRTAVQLSLGLAGVPDRVVPPKHDEPKRARCNEPSGVLVEAFCRRLAATGASRKAQQAYVFQLEQLLAAAHRQGPEPGQGLSEVLRNTALLGRALSDDRGARCRTLSRWTLAQRRAGVRAFARLMAPELRQALQAEPEEVVIAALRGVAERVGGGYHLSGGMPRRRGGRAPEADE